MMVDCRFFQPNVHIYQLVCHTPVWGQNAVVTQEVGQSKTLNFTLTPGNVKESMTVSDEAPLITTDRADRGTVVENQFVTSIPLLTCNPLLLVSRDGGSHRHHHARPATRG
jgi:hypothetical protein